MKRYNLSQIMKQAHRFFKITGQSFAECLKKAWSNAKLVLRMKMQITHFYFKKVSGEIREAWGTLQEDLLPATVGGNKKRNEDCQVYFDTEKREYRRFKKLNLISFEE